MITTGLLNFAKAWASLCADERQRLGEKLVARKLEKKGGTGIRVIRDSHFIGFPPRVGWANKDILS